MKILPLIFILLIGSLRAANYYVDYAAGADTNNGTSTSTPFKRCPGDPAATNTALGTSLSPGDTVFFKGGVTYHFTGATGIRINISGTAGNLITYDGNSAGSWGTGKAKFTDDYSANSIEAFGTATTRNYIALKSLDIGPIGGSATLPVDTGSYAPAKPGAGINLPSTTGSLIDSCDFHEIGYWFNQKPMDAQHSIDGGGINCPGAQSLTINGCTFTKMSIGIEASVNVASIAGLTITNNDMHNYIRWGIDLGSYGTTSIDNVIIEHNYLHDFAEYTDANWTGYGEWPHVDGIFWRHDGGGSPTWGSNNHVRYNRFVWGAGTAGGGTAVIYITEGPSVNITNNLFAMWGCSDGMVYINNTGATGTQVVRVLHNTFHTSYNSAVAIAGNYHGNSTYSIQNNIFSDQYGHAGDVNSPNGNLFCVYINSSDPLAGLTLNGNHYFNYNTGGTIYNAVGGTTKGGEYSVATLRSALGFETNGAQGNPLFATLNWSDASASDFRLQSGSPAKDAAITNPITIADDLNGVARPQGVSSDRGAFEYLFGSVGGASDTPNNPRPLRILTGTL